MMLHDFCRRRIASNLQWRRYDYAMRWCWLMLTRKDWSVG